MTGTHALPLILGIETSCDDTACAVLDGDGRVLSSVVASQLASHRPYGGVVPEIASREHLVNWPAVCDEALSQASLDLDQIDLVAATRGPGLVGSLLVGLATGKAIAWSLGRRFYGVHHIEGHIFSPFLATAGEAAAAVPPNFVALVVSGGHTSLFEVVDGQSRTVAETRDDAIGEVFDKVGKRLGLPYPQGPIVDQLAEAYGGPKHPNALPVPRLDGGDLFFSYSGLKSAAIRQLEVIERQALAEYQIPRERQISAEHQDPSGRPTTPGAAMDPSQATPAHSALLSEFRRAAVTQILNRLERYHRTHKITTLAVSGGVAANRLLRRELVAWAEDRSVDLRLVPLEFCGDNAAMIAHAAWLRHRHDPTGDDWSIEAAGRLRVGEA